MIDKNPIADEKTPTKGASTTSRLGWIVAGIISLLMLVFFALWISARVENREIATLQGKLDEEATQFTPYFPDTVCKSKLLTYNEAA